MPSRRPGSGPTPSRRVFSAIGTYVGLRGGNDYPTLIRKYEPKPIRVFLQDGDNDLNIYGGDWWMANQEMERSLTFAGYEVNHVWGEGGHNGKHATEVFPDAMRWLWKDWPEPEGRARLAATPGDPDPRRGLGTRRRGLQVHRGPGRQREGRGVLQRRRREQDLQDRPRRQADGRGWRIRSTATARLRPGRPALRRRRAARSLAYDAAGQGHRDRRGLPRQRPRRPARRRHLRHQPRSTTPGNSKVWYIAPDGEKKTVDTGLNFANGITLSPDQSLLYVADSRTHWVYSYQIQPDGSLANKQKYFHLHVPDTGDDSGADGLRTDRDGRLYVATRIGLQVCDQAGRVNCIIPTPNGKCANLTFGGPDFDVIYAACGDKVFKRKVKVKGADHAQPPFKPTTPR